MKAYRFNRFQFVIWCQIGYRDWRQRFYAYVWVWFPRTERHMTISLPRSPLWHLPFPGDNINCLHKLSNCLCGRRGCKLMGLWLNDCWNTQCRCLIHLISPRMQDPRSWTLRWSWFSGWGRERVSILFDYEGGQYIKQSQYRTKVNILQFTVWYLNATMNRTTWKLEPEIGTDGWNQTRHNPRVDGYRYGFIQPRGST